MLRLSGGMDPLPGGPFALYDTVVDVYSASVWRSMSFYLVIGKMTELLGPPVLWRRRGSVGTFG
jgi:hypothetical protein